MNKKILFSVLLSSAISPLAAFAQLRSYGPELDVFGFMDSIISVSWIIFGAIAVICFVISGILFLTAAGDPTKLHTARSSFYWGVAGIIIGIIAYSIISIVSSMISGYGNNNYNNYNNYGNYGGYNNGSGINIQGGYSDENFNIQGGVNVDDGGFWGSLFNW